MRRAFGILLVVAALTGPGVSAQDAGSKITISPAVATGGTVVRATGTGFGANNQLVLRWTRGITAGSGVNVTTAADGTFSAQVLVFRRDVLGQRRLTASSPAALQLRPIQSAPVLVVAGTAQPRDFRNRR